jgi:hypothetical protein
MVDDRGQLYTIEGFAAAIIMVFTIFLVLSSTTVYTPGDSHISNLQLEQLGHDVLWTMNLPPASASAQSLLQQYIGENNAVSFNTTFMNGINNKTGFATDTLQYSASVTCRDGSNIIQTPFAYSRNMTGREHAVRVTQWVLVQQTCPLSPGGPIPGNPHAMLVEVLLWRE